MPSNWYFAFLGVYYLSEWLHTTANLNIAILQTVKVAAEAIAHWLYFGTAIWLIMQTLIFWRIWRPFSQIDWAMYLILSPSWISQIIDKCFSPEPRARFFSMDWNSPCLLKVLHVFLYKKTIFFVRASIFLT